jgi:hypothetical protein
MDAATILGVWALLAYNPQGTSGDAGLLAVTSLYLAGSPVVHGLHGHGRRAAGSVALRAGALVTGLALFVGTLSSATCPFWLEDNRSWPGYCWIGVTAPIYLPLAAMVIDDVFLSREEALRAPAASAGWMPRVQVAPGLALVGLGTRF